jgi:hypothetical protein
METTTSNTAAPSVEVPRLVRLFVSEECNALATALENVAREWHPESECNTKEAVYRYLEAQPRTTMIAELVQHLHRLGYRIEPNNMISTQSNAP